jgi:hypothetical protein
MVFPVAARTTTAPGSGPAEAIHHGIDIMAAKMTPIVAIADGSSPTTTAPATSHGSTGTQVLHFRITHAGGGCPSIHLNNDTPGTDDGQGWGLPQHRHRHHGPGGTIDRLGGDSGNAEGTLLTSTSSHGQGRGRRGPVSGAKAAQTGTVALCRPPTPARRHPARHHHPIKRDSWYCGVELQRFLTAIGYETGWWTGSSATSPWGDLPSRRAVASTRWHRRIGHPTHIGQVYASCRRCRCSTT